MAAEVIAFPDIEAICGPHLESELASRSIVARVGTKIPSPRPDRFVKVTRTGGAQKNIKVDSPQVTFECWDADEPSASNLARVSRALVGAMSGQIIGGATIIGCTEFSGPKSFPDPDTSQSRYQFSVYLDIAGQAI